MITSNGKKIIDIIICGNNDVAPVTIRKGIYADGSSKYDADIVYDRHTKVELIDGYNHVMDTDYFLNVGDGARYYMRILNKTYTVTDISCDCPNVSIINNCVQYNEAGTFTITLKYKSYTVTQNVNISHLSIALA